MIGGRDIGKVPPAHERPVSPMVGGSRGKRHHVPWVSKTLQSEGLFTALFLPREVRLAQDTFRGWNRPDLRLEWMRDGSRSP